MQRCDPEESFNEDRTLESDEDQDNWDQELIRAVGLMVGKVEKDPEKVRLDRINVCLDEGAYINVQDRRNGDTVLHVAVRKNYPKIVKLVRQRGARTDIPNHKGDTAIRLAEILHKKEIECILKGPVEQRSELQICRSSGARHFVTAADYQEPSTSRGSDMPAVRIFTARFHSSEHEERIRESPGFVAPKTYPANATLTRSWPGIIYQLEHLEFTLHCAFQKGFKFRLAAEMLGAGKLDDVVLQYENHEGIRVARLVQLKYSVIKCNILAKRLIEDDGDFSVSNYFMSWLEIKRHELFGDIEVRNMILCTTMGLDVKCLEKQKIYCDRVKEPDTAFELKSDKKDPAWYRFPANNETNEKLYSKLRKCVFRKLVKLVVECVYKNNPMRLEVESFRDYHLALAKYVFNISHGTKTYEFRQDFIENYELSQRVGEFRQSFLSDYREMAKLPKKLHPEESVWEDVKERIGKLAFQPDFGKSPKVPNPHAKNELPDDIDDTEISDFFKEFILAVDQPGIPELEAIISRMIRDYDQCSELRADRIGSAFRTKIMKWFCNKGENGNDVEYLTDEVCKRLLDDDKHRIDEVNELVRKPVVKFQGYETSFRKLLDINDPYHLSADEVEVFTSTVDSRTVIKIMLGHEISIGEDLRGPSLLEDLRYRAFCQYVDMEDNNTCMVSMQLNTTPIDRRFADSSTEFRIVVPAKRTDGICLSRSLDGFRLTIISNDFIMGKALSTYFAKKIKEDEPDFYVLQIDLRKHLSALANIWEKRASDDSDIINGAVQFLLNEFLGGRPDLDKKVFKRKILQRKVALIFDGIDELDPMYQDIAIDFLHVLSNYSSKNFLVSRLPAKRVFGNAFSAIEMNIIILH